VCIGIGQVQLRFYQPSKQSAGKWEPGATVCLEEGFELARAEGSTRRVFQSNFKAEAGVLTELLGETVLRLQALPLNELKIWFTGDVSLQLLTEPQGFESYSLHQSGNSITVLRHSVA